MKKIFRRFFLSISFLTILPVHWLFPGQKQGSNDYIEEDLSKSSIFFPIAGIVIGLMLAGTDHLLKSTSLSQLLITGIILTVWISLSGGLHLEGFADMIDGFSGGKNQEEIIKIMKDGSIGAKGAIALVLLILLKFLLINSLQPPLRIYAFFLAPVLGRWAMVLAGYLGKPASSKNTISLIFSKYLGTKELILATIFALTYSFYLLSYPSLYLFVISGIITYLLISYSIFKMQGICGDIIGAVNEIVEAGVLLFFLFLPY